MSEEALAATGFAATVRPVRRTLDRWRGWPALFMLLLTGSLVVFTLVPGTIEGKSLAVLHGLCAQQPTHSYYFGDSRLPFDARMTGIYGGFALTCLFLLARGRWRAAAVPPPGMIVLLAAFILPLAVDGFNSLLRDVHAPYLYEPRNVLRTFTGLLTGTTLATFVWLLIGQVAFRRDERSSHQLWPGYGEFLALVGIQAGFAALVLTRWSPLRLPLTYLLILSAVLALTGLMLAFVVLAMRRECQARETWELARPATVALVLAFVIMGMTGGGRFALEAIFGLPSQLPA